MSIVVILSSRNNYFITKRTISKNKKDW